MNKYKMTGSVLLAAVLVSGLLAGCAAASGNTTGMEGEEENMSVNTENKMTDEENLHTIYLAGGCFWGVEAYMKKLPGVKDTEVGYANGNTENPTYEEVCYNNTGHAETVKVVYDTQLITTQQLLDGFFKVVDPNRGMIGEASTVPVSTMWTRKTGISRKMCWQSRRKGMLFL